MLEDAPRPPDCPGNHVHDEKLKEGQVQTLGKTVANHEDEVPLSAICQFRRDQNAQKTHHDPHTGLELDPKGFQQRAKTSWTLHRG